MEEKSPTPVIEKTATPSTPSTEPVKSVNGTAPEKTTSDAKSVAPEQTAPSNEDTFTSVDVKSLSPELKSKYDAMLTDYKKKTTEAAQQRKDAEARYKEVQDVLQDPNFQKTYQQLNASQQAVVKQESGVTEEEFNKAFENKDNFAGFVQKVANISNAQSQQRIVDLEASLAVKDFKSAHPKFDELNKHNAITLQLRADPRAGSTDPKQWQAALETAYGNAERVYTELLEEGRRQGLERVQQKVAASTEPPTSTPAAANPFGDPKKWTTRQAIEAARQGYRVTMNQ